jgi:hypothetical protein
MTATFTEKRRPGPTPPRPLRELPVLFHLMDVSRPKGYAAPAAPQFTLAPPVERVTELPAALAAQPPEPLSERPQDKPCAAESPACELPNSPAFDLETAASLVETKGFGAIPPAAPPAPSKSESSDFESLTTSSTPADVVENSIPAASAEDLFASEMAKSEQEAAAELTTPPAADALDATSSVEDLPADSPTAETEDPVSLRQRSEERQRKRQAAAKNDWLSTHGKFIAIAFVLALFTTIYAARANRGKSPSAASEKPIAVSPSPSSGSLTTVVTAPSQSGVSPAGAITTVGPTAESASAESRTALHPPTIPQLAVEPALSTPTTGDALFSFTKKTEERVAQRDPSSSPSETTSSTEPQPSAPSPTSATPPPAQPQYPTTSYGGNYQPVAPTPVAPSAPSPTLQYPQQPQSAAAPPPTATAPSAYPQSIYQPAASGTALPSTYQYPTTNTATGPRHERNGSGIY